MALRQIGGLSLGTSRLVEIARALATCPSVVLLDEPLSGLSTGEADRLADVLVHAAVERQIAMFLVEHDVPMVLKLCSKVFVLDFGQLIASGTAAQIRDDPGRAGGLPGRRQPRH